MVPVPVGAADAKQPIAEFWIGRTEVTWDAYDVFVYRLDEPGESAPRADAVARPSKPYISMDRGFGHNGHPAISMSHKGAEAFCRWAGRRLPTAAEWEVAAPQVDWGHSVWEWTADPFAPYAGFRPAPYHTYSAPWFHHQREVRGGAFATHALVHDRRYRNFFLAHRTDVFTGFRTAAI